ncbi:MAG TPA: HD domain-containing protein [Halanaerobiaceae bacterium]|nr:HD domain-containing protein [Halanaerobiaceae bacterium]
MITFDKEKDLLLLRLIDTPEFQRLRRIRQLGVSWITYPTAEHTRFSHSIGTAFLAGKIFDKLELEEQITFNDEDGEHTLSRDQLKLLLQTTALLHDIGHGPFSHAFETVMDQNHEEWSVKIITDKSTHINQVILADDKELDEVIPYKIRKNFPKWICDILNGVFDLHYIKEIISSQLDADRMDYLLRDAYMCGVKYARFDLDWIINNLNIGEIKHENNRKGIIVNAEKGIYSLESFIISRYHMYEQVYFHKTTRAAEKLIQAIFMRLKYLVDNKEEEKIIPREDTILALLNKDSISVQEYLKLDDFLLITYIKKWSEESEDKILRHLCSNFINRNPHKLVSESEDNLFTGEEWESVINFFREKQLDYKYFYVIDYYTDVPYKNDYLFGKKTSEDAGHIWLKDNKGKLTELAEASDIIKSLRNNIKKKTRVYCDRKFYKELKEIMGG